ncbi:Protein of unknown function DUF1639 [Dillenia turbinata]|uniref:Uncharacterized protein n=1 Tax=Dillenia turbinata TaxID=194707 RepID=A0AAN8W5H9_9MAGN
MKIEPAFGLGFILGRPSVVIIPSSSSSPLPRLDFYGGPPQPRDRSADLEIQMEEEDKKSHRELLLQWGNRKRLRCVRVRDSGHANSSDRSNPCSSAAARETRANRCVLPTSDKHRPQQNPHLQTNRNSCETTTAAMRGGGERENRKSASPEKEDLRYYTTRGSVGLEENGGGKMSLLDGVGVEDRGVVWPKLYISLSSKEKEEDFMAMKGCKLPQRPKKRAKLIQRTLLLVSPGAWLSDMCQERYEVREKKISKKRPRGLKAMGGSMESDSE